MKKILKSVLMILIATIIFSGCSTTKAVTQVSDSNSIGYQNFYDDLSPFGTWIEYPGYGQVWHPMISGDFRPYFTNGYWDYSDQGWMWMSNYNWGWAPFHYGRWMYDDLYGWLWVPGYEWSPAWVTWGMFDDFYAWAPLMPGVNVGIAFSTWVPTPFYWNIVGANHIYDRDLYRSAIDRDHIPDYVKRISIINNFGNTSLHNHFYSRGPAINDVERYTRRTITPASIKTVNNKVMANRDGNQIQVFRPVVTNPMPREFRRIDNNSYPFRTNDERINNNFDQQRQNIDRLPVNRAPAIIFNNREGNSENRGRRNLRN